MRIARRGDERIVRADDRGVHPVSRLDLVTTRGDDVQLDRFHALAPAVSTHHQVGGRVVQRS